MIINLAFVLLKLHFLSSNKYIHIFVYTFDFVIHIVAPYLLKKNYHKISARIYLLSYNLQFRTEFYIGTFYIQ